MIKNTDIFDAVVRALPLCDIDHHYSDLYFRVTPESRAIVHSYEYNTVVTTFFDQVTGKLWYEVPFAYPGPWDKSVKSYIQEIKGE